MGQLFNIFGLYASFPKQDIIFGIYLTKMVNAWQKECDMVSIIISHLCKILSIKILHRCNGRKKISWLISVGNIS